PEVAPRHGGDARAMQQALSEVIAVLAVAADIHVNVERPVRPDWYLQAQALELWQQIVATLLERLAAPFEDAKHFGFEASDGGMLGQAGRTDAEVRSKLVQRRDHPWRCNHPAQAPA